MSLRPLHKFVEFSRLVSIVKILLYVFRIHYQFRAGDKRKQLQLGRKFCWKLLKDHTHNDENKIKKTTLKQINLTEH